jgi:SDR family mycofactocin-dependent oxidoreductase
MEERMGLLDGKTVFITGAARGQGRAHALTSAREGADVLLLDVPEAISAVQYPLGTEADLDVTKKEVEALGRRAITVTGDVRSQATLDQAVAHGISELGKIDIVIANAGVWNLAPFWEITAEAWQAMIGTNLTGVWQTLKAVAPHMIERESGSIVITTSMNAHEGGPNFAHYTAAKHGLLGLMRTVALELAPFGIRCNAVSPGAIRTPMNDHQIGYDMMAGHEGGTEDDYIAGGYSYAALKGHSMLPPEVIADAALFLNSELASAITGVALPVDAGHLLLTGFNHSPTK